jgi:hypothetical protein
MGNKIEFIIPLLVLALGVVLPRVFLEVSGFGAPVDVDGIYSSVLVMIGLSVYYWGKKFAPPKLKHRIASVFIWSDKSVAKLSIFLFFASFVLGLLSAFAIVVVNNLDGWLKITLELLFCAVSGYAFLGLLIFDRIDDNSGL